MAKKIKTNKIQKNKLTNKEKKKVNQFKIIITVNNKQKNFIGFYRGETKAYEAFNNFKKENEKVKIPIEITTSTIAKPINYEVVLLKKKNDEDDLITKVKNNYGEYIDHKTNSEKWIVYDKMPYYIEEKFWVYGYNPKTQRKTVDWIFEHLVKPYASVKDNFLNIYIYKNKVLFDSTNKFNMVICKNIGDAIRLYNQIECDFKSNKDTKYAIFTGDCNQSKIRTKLCLNKMQELTNWSKNKLYRYSTRMNVTEYKKRDD
jgi:hypothetical protein